MYAALFWVGKGEWGKWGIILGVWRWMGHFLGQVEVGGIFFRVGGGGWVNILGGQGWVVVIEGDCIV